MSAPSSRGELRFVTQKVFDEMASLYSSDPVRWGSAALAARYGAPLETTRAVVELVQRDERNDVHHEKRKMLAEKWIQISMRDYGTAGFHSAMSRFGRQKFDATRAGSRAELQQVDDDKQTPSFRVIDELFEAAMQTNKLREMEQSSTEVNDSAHAKSQSTSGSAEEAVAAAASIDSSTAVSEVDSSSDGIDGGYEVARLVRAAMDDPDNLDVSRKTSFAFIDGCAPDGTPPAVWIRDGPSGKLRMPTTEERKHLLGGPQRRFLMPIRKGKL